MEERKPTSAKENIDKWLKEDPEEDERIRIYKEHSRLTNTKQMNGKQLRRFNKRVLGPVLTVSKGAPFKREIIIRERLQAKFKAQQMYKVELAKLEDINCSKRELCDDCLQKFLN